MLQTYLLVQSDIIQQKRPAHVRWMIALVMFTVAFVLSVALMYTIRCLSMRSAQAIMLVPAFALSIEWTHLTVVAVYCAALIVGAPTKYINWCFLPMMLLIAYELSQSTTALLDRDSYIKHQLYLSWAGADNSTLDDIRMEWHCTGFDATSDTSCIPKLVEHFGPVIYIWGVGLWIVKILQVVGLLASYALYLNVEETLIPSEATDVEAVDEKTDVLKPLLSEYQ